MRLLILLCVLGSLPLQTTAERSRPKNILELFGGSENLDIFTQSEHVEACLLQYTKPTVTDEEYAKLNDDESVKLIYDSFREGEYRGISKRSLTEIRDKLLREDTYKWNMVRDCPPEYGLVRLRFSSLGKTLKISISFRCHYFGISLDDKPISGGYFDHDGGVLLRSMKALFPEDLVLQKLK